MITSASEFLALRSSNRPDEYNRAAQDNAPDRVWNEIIDSYPEMREWVAHNKTVPITILGVLANDPSPRVREAVASKRKLTESLQLLLAQDNNPSVRERLVHNARVSLSVLRLLAQDPEFLIREKAQRKIRTRTANQAL
jgi:hypothetical protein